ncbi:hypothetical protein LINPERHAP1_LOCUS1420 [Linum perenne]
MGSYSWRFIGRPEWRPHTGAHPTTCWRPGGCRCLHLG